MSKTKLMGIYQEIPFIGIPLGMKVQFKKDNKIRFFMDMNGWEGTPHDIVFTVADSAGSDHESHWLIAHGFGIISGKEGSYGSGGIMVKDNIIKDNLINTNTK